MYVERLFHNKPINPTLNPNRWTFEAAPVDPVTLEVEFKTATEAVVSPIIVRHRYQHKTKQIQSNGTTTVKTKPEYLDKPL